MCQAGLGGSPGVAQSQSSVNAARGGSLSFVLTVRVGTWEGARTCCRPGNETTQASDCYFFRAGNISL